MDDRSSAEAVARTVESLLPELGNVADATPVPKGHGHECWRVEAPSES